MSLIRHAQAKQIARDAVVLDLGDVQQQAAQLMEQARRRADAMLAEARAERERIIAGASEKGHAEGTARGLEEGRKCGAEQGQRAALAEWRPRLETLEKRWSEALAGLESQRDRMLTEARTDVLRLALACTEKVVKRAIAVDPSVVTAQLEAVLAMVARPTELVVAVHPSDRALVASAMPALLARFQAVRHVELVDDPELAPGSCVSRSRASAGGAAGGASAGGEVDASIGTQLDRIAEILLPSPRTDGGGA